MISKVKSTSTNLNFSSDTEYKLHEWKRLITYMKIKRATAIEFYCGVKLDMIK